MKVKNALVAGVLVSALTALGGCGGSDKADPIPTTKPTPTATAATPAWMAKYSPDELKTYNEALATFHSYEQDSEPIWEAGKVTPTAKKLFQKYFITWQNQLINLDFDEQHGVTQVGIPKVLSSEATRIKISKNTGDVTIRQCVDFASVTTSQDGKVIKPVTDKPQLRDINIDKPEDTWLIVKITNAEGGNRPCDG